MDGEESTAQVTSGKTTPTAPGYHLTLDAFAHQKHIPGHLGKVSSTFFDETEINNGG